MSVGRKVRELRECAAQVAARQELARGRAGGAFVIGSPRAGTTEVATALAQHPELWTSQESRIFFPLIGPDEQGRSLLHQLYLRGSSRAVAPTPYPEFARALGCGLDRLLRSRSGGRRWIDSSSENLLVAEELAFLFPAAPFVLVTRDGRAVVRSAVAAGVVWAKDVKSAAELWAHWAREGLAFAAGHPDRVLTLTVERLAGDPENELARLYAFLGEEPSEAAAPHLRRWGLSVDYGCPVPTADGFEMFDVPVDGAWDDWNAEDRETFEAAAGDAMRGLGYWH